jgi:hypothetical protein
LPNYHILDCGHSHTHTLSLLHTAHTIIFYTYESCTLGLCLFIGSVYITSVQRKDLNPHTHAHTPTNHRQHCFRRVLHTPPQLALIGVSIYRHNVTP